MGLTKDLAVMMDSLLRDAHFDPSLNDAQVFQQGDYEDHEQFETRVIAQYLLFVCHITKQVVTINHPEFEDYFQEGCIGLLKAIRNFDISRGIKFLTFAGHVAKNEMLMYARKQSEGGLTGIRKFKLLRAELAKMQTMYPEKTIPELAKMIDVPLYEMALLEIGHVRSLSELLGETEETIELELTIAASDNTELEYETRERLMVVLDVIQGAMVCASQAQQGIIMDYYNELITSNTKLKQRELAEKYNLSQSYVSRILNRIRREIKALRSWEKAVQRRTENPLSGEEFLRRLNNGEQIFREEIITRV